MENPTEKELEVALILQSLPELVLQSTQCRRNRSHLPRWATKKRRTRRVPRLEKLLSPTSQRPDSPPPPFSLTDSHAGDLLSAEAEKLKGAAPSSSPASPLDFYPSGTNTGNNPAATAAAKFSTFTRPAKKMKLKSKELLKGNIKLVDHLSETNKLLKQEKANYTKHHEALLEENSRLKMLLSKSKLSAAKTKRDPPRLLLLQQCSREFRTYPTPLGPGGPTVDESPVNLPPLKREEALNKTTAGCSPPPQPPTPMQPSIEEKQLNCLAPVRFWSFDGGCVGYMDPVAQMAPGQLEASALEIVNQRSPPCDAKRKATADARKRRMEMKRMKSGGGVATLATFGNAGKVR